MRTVLTIIAVALVAVMSVALVGPYFVDWSAQRGEIEARLGAITGSNVSLTGPVELRLLPTPYLALGGGLVSAPGPEGAKLSFGSARLELALVKLASGQIRFSDIRLDKPVLTLTRGPGGALKAPPLRMAGLHATGFDRLSVEDGEVRIVNPADGARLEISGVEIDAAAPSLDGPMRLSGQFSGPGAAPVAFRLASEKPGPDGTPVHVAVDAGPGWPGAEFNGALEGDPAAGIGGLGFAGDVTLTGEAPGEGAPMPWRVKGPVAVDLNRAALRGAQFSLGPDERAIRATGDATLAFGSPPRITIALKASQANVDGLLRRKGEDAATPARAVALIVRIAAAALRGREGPMAVDARVSAQPVILGAQTLPDASAALKAEPGAPLHLAFNLGLPGQSRLSADGDLEVGAEARFRGDVAFASADVALLRDWASRGAPPALAKAVGLAGALPYREASLKGAVEASGAGVSGRNLKLTLDRTALTGAVAYTGPADGRRGRLALDLATDSLDVEALPSLAAENAIAGLDLALSLRAGSLHIARVGEAEIDSGSLTVNLTRTGPDIALKRLSVAGLNGASLEVEGAVHGDETEATGRLRADRLHDFAALIARLAPGDWSRILVERAGELSPAGLTFEAHGGPAGAGGLPPIDKLKVNGSAGETQFSVALDPRPKGAGRALKVSLDSPDSGALLRQLGVKATAVGGHAHVSVDASGAWEKGYDVDASSTLAGADLTWRGRFAPRGGSDEARLFGSARIKAANLAPLAAALGLAPANGAALGPADIGFDATLRGDQWTFSRLAASIDGVKASGDLTFRPVQPVVTLDALSKASAEVARAEDAVGAGGRKPALAPAAIGGNLTIERMSLGALVALALGPPPPSRAGTRWPEARFAPPPLKLPSAAVNLKVGTLDMGDGVAARDFTTMLRLDKGRLDLDGFAMRIADGSAKGHATLRRDGEAATLTGALSLDAVAVDRPGFSGRLGTMVDFASTGLSPAALIAGLAGSGQVTFGGAALARADPAALDRVVAKAQSPDAPLDETNVAYAFGNELNRGPLAIPDGPAPVSLSAGVAKIGPIGIPEERGEGTLSADIDLRRLAVSARLRFASSASGLKFWSGPPPAATVGIDNVLEAPKRRIDVSGLSAALAAQAIARETDRISTMEADIRERAYFNRRLKGERFMDKRRQEIEAFEAEQARLKQEAERLRAEEEADKASPGKAEPGNEATDRARPAPPARAPFAPAPAPRSDEVGANAPPQAPPKPPPRPKARPNQPGPATGGLY